LSIGAMAPIGLPPPDRAPKRLPDVHSELGLDDAVKR